MFFEGILIYFVFKFTGIYQANENGTIGSVPIANIVIRALKS
jgi:hypothetical protein